MVLQDVRQGRKREAGQAGGETAHQGKFWGQKLPLVTELVFLVEQRREGFITRILSGQITGHVSRFRLLQVHRASGEE